ncbi:MAG TPA: tRNA guanosine(34) transglycosylase Tgt [Spirochaetota bacterium]|nr:tRNA guanosine(34) transglycosylase Tgt [Spirochaetota bacterium]HOM38909.1 tRNA guanosine(34) transglycosylase Tgt [Spirochaetota bacterium]HPQ49112.1 tRNA guanosine(34) transglycosylase Tgt [Spirochaetota bacterium]
MKYKRPFFKLVSKDINSKARAGVLELPYGNVNTPVFMPVGTIGTVKTLSGYEIKELGYNLILHNTYHLYIRPGLEIIKEFGGIRGINKWDGNILTDSGGFQVFSLSKLVKIKENGVEFANHLSGEKLFLSPELVIDIQLLIGSDILMPLDICTEKGASYNQVKEDKDITVKWLRKSKNYIEKIDDHPFLFGITQGNIYHDLRKECIKEMIELDMDGYSIGGLSVGEEKEVMYEIIDISTEILPKDKPRYLMGVGAPEDIVEAVDRGVDMFDCVMPTRNARNGSLFTWNGKINIKNAKYKNDKSPIDEKCQCFTCKNFNLAYLNHLFKTRELLAYRLATIHNLYFMNELMKNIRESIIDNSFKNFKSKFLKNYKV